MWPKYVEEAQGERRDDISVSRDQTHSLLRVFVKRVNGTQRRLLGLWRRHRIEETSFVVFQLPLRRFQLIVGAFRRRDRGPVGRAAKPLAVDARRRGDDEAFDG